MRQPPPPNSARSAAASASSSGGGASPTDADKAAGKMRPPTPEEVLSHYESQGMDSREAALAAIGDLKSLLQKSLNSRRVKKELFMSDALRRIDNANARLALLERKLDSKPGAGQFLAIGLASGALLQGFGAVLPHVVGGLRDMWSSVQAATESSEHSG